MRKEKAISVLTVIAVLLAAVGCQRTTEAENSKVQGKAQAETASENIENTEGAGTESSYESSENEGYYNRYAGMTAEEITATLSLQEKANQMVIPAIYNVREYEMKTNNYGSILSTYGFVEQTADEWAELIDNYQDSALQADAPIPFVYGQDSVHGVNYCVGTVIFPQNINIGAANDAELAYQMGLAVADEIMMTKMIWNYAPCVAVASDPRWGRTYESYSSDVEIVKDMSGSFTKGLLENGIIACPKHYLADGSVLYGTGESDEGTKRLIDRGVAQLSEEEIEAQLEIYQNLIDLGAQSIMISHSALNGVKMHENAYYINDILKDKMGFKGVVVSDWESIHNIDGADELKEQVIIAVNAGIDLLMEPAEYRNCSLFITEAVNEGKISQERIDDAVTRIIQLKLDAGVFEDPYLSHIETKQKDTGSDAYRAIARQLVEKSLVLVKNEKETLPIRKGSKIFVIGPAADDTGVQCGGWTRQWNGLTDEEYGGKLIESGTTILEALEALAEEYDLTIITDADKAKEADLTILCVGEKPYAEWNGDTADLELTGALGLNGNEEAIKAAKELGKPTVALIVAGRNVIIDEYIQQWDSIVMCYLPGSEGGGIADVLLGKKDFTGKLPMPWYSSVEDINTKTAWLEEGYGLSINE